MSKKNKKEKKLFPFALLTGNPTKPNRISLSSTAPKELTLIYTAPNLAIAEWLRQLLSEAGFKAEYVPSVITALSGMTGNVNIYVPHEQANSAIDFLSQFEETSE